ncbi:50S ribosomal protein L24 [Candidatus Woesearchaeota archaeon]|nr:50S ribosomal protein L24 [Candidatus Woesearchaeota archaeon]
MKIFSKSWKGSIKTSKQRKYRIMSPLHIKHKFVHSHLSKELRQKYSKRSIALRKGDKVKLIVGKFKKHEGKVEKIELKKGRVYVAGVEITKRDGSKKLLPLHPSNLMITELNLDDKLRAKALERK